MLCLKFFSSSLLTRKIPFLDGARQMIHQLPRGSDCTNLVRLRRSGADEQQSPWKSDPKKLQSQERDCGYE